MLERRPLLLALAVLAVSTLNMPARGQSVFPVRFGTPDPSALSRQSPGSLSLDSGGHFSEMAALNVTPAASQRLLTVQAGGNTTVLVRVTAASRQSGNSTDPGSIIELYWWAIYADGSWLIDEYLASAYQSNDFTFGLNTSTNELTFTVNTPPDHNRLTVDIEAMANKAVTYTRHY